MVKLGRNETCHCGSGKKYKKCCLSKDDGEARVAHAAAEAERKKTAAEREPAEDAPASTESELVQKGRSPFEGKSGFWENNDRGGQTSGSTGRSPGSGHR
jgi:hypothetical protein